MAFSHELVPVEIAPYQSIASVMDVTSNIKFGGTDCSLPMVWANRHRIPVDAFIVITDSETNHGNQSPADALRQYRGNMRIDAKLIVMGLTASQFTIADPSDPGMLDIAGLDTATADTLTAFICDGARTNCPDMHE